VTGLCPRPSHPTGLCNSRLSKRMPSEKTESPTKPFSNDEMASSDPGAASHAERAPFEKCGGHGERHSPEIVGNETKNVGYRKAADVVPGERDSALRVVPNRLERILLPELWQALAMMAGFEGCYGRQLDDQTSPSSSLELIGAGQILKRPHRRRVRPGCEEECCKCAGSTAI
jgi:hypothetical protein